MPPVQSDLSPVAQLVDSLTQSLEASIRAKDTAAAREAFSEHLDRLKPLRESATVGEREEFWVAAAWWGVHHLARLKVATLAKRTAPVDVDLVTESRKLTAIADIYQSWGKSALDSLRESLPLPSRPGRDFVEQFRRVAAHSTLDEVTQKLPELYYNRLPQLRQPNRPVFLQCDGKHSVITSDLKAYFRKEIEPAILAQKPVARVSARASRRKRRKTEAHGSVDVLPEPNGDSDVEIERPRAAPSPLLASSPPRIPNPDVRTETPPVAPSPLPSSNRSRALIPDVHSEEPRVSLLPLPPQSPSGVSITVNIDQGSDISAATRRSSLNIYQQVDDILTRENDRPDGAHTVERPSYGATPVRRNSPGHAMQRQPQSSPNSQCESPAAGRREEARQKMRNAIQRAPKPALDVLHFICQLTQSEDELQGRNLGARKALANAEAELKKVEKAVSKLVTSEETLDDFLASSKERLASTRNFRKRFDASLRDASNIAAQAGITNLFPPSMHTDQWAEVEQKQEKILETAHDLQGNLNSASAALDAKRVELNKVEEEKKDVQEQRAATVEILRLADSKWPFSELADLYFQAQGPA
ncbi:uncharacterized protein CC84DRAFT_1210780 [Paraphaeosphaeria sporulosa]|uniref:Uncharacterized protein n=1 Tax=Paraphaeosphaeria sporulosa TaxID=1460663 RepID=A0A177BV45_9PLEO|nr:uncharacterized protein CC84DRAFT_1210780 [Paraphaeosphaeria sporulosa]OAF98528.1 hypothetical protein CC84DRAFT_1210780 [Paraphaeosphaeria sporulosa]